MKVSIFFAWFDLWIGAYYDQKKRTLYFCLLPCCVIKLELAQRWTKEELDAAEAGAKEMAKLWDD
jgi:hypothetical protein